MKLTFLVIGILFAVNPAIAAPKQIISKLVDQYYESKDLVSIMSSQDSKHNPECDNVPHSQGCIDAACSKLGSFGCDETDEVKAVSKACRGNYGGGCLTAACAKLGSFGCDEQNEVTSVARACVGNYNSDCLNSVCSKLGSFGCDELSEVTEVAASCSGY